MDKSVGYQVRLEARRSRATHLLFCTTGVLLRRLASDPLLTGVTHIVVDEIHERGMNEDFLLIVLRDLLPRRPDLKLVLMSATLNADLFSHYFSGAPTLHIPGFTYPVRSYFLEDVLELTGHEVTLYNQVDDYGSEQQWKRRRQMALMEKRRNSLEPSFVQEALSNHSFGSHSPFVQRSMHQWTGEGVGFSLIESALEFAVRRGPRLLAQMQKEGGREGGRDWGREGKGRERDGMQEREEERREGKQDVAGAVGSKDAGAVLVFMTGWDDIIGMRDRLREHPLLGDESRVLLLTCHGSMPIEEQKLIFNPPPPGITKVILATNMAETSITINDVALVIDTGKAKETSYDAVNNVPCLLPQWVSKASVKQRRGRAGRVRPGVCFHLYPRPLFAALPDYGQPELLRAPLHSLCLQIKTLGLGNIGEFLGKAIQPPEPLAVDNAIELLEDVGALDKDENLTPLGTYGMAWHGMAWPYIPTIPYMCLTRPGTQVAHSHAHTHMPFTPCALPLEPLFEKILVMAALLSCANPLLPHPFLLSTHPFHIPFSSQPIPSTSSQPTLLSPSPGRHLTALPLEPRVGKMLVMAAVLSSVKPFRFSLNPPCSPSVFLTLAGRHLTALPLEPRVGKMLVMAAVLSCVNPVLTVGATLSEREPWVRPADKREAGLYIDNVLKRFEMELCTPVATPLPLQHLLTAPAVPTPEACFEPYLELVGSLMYAMMCTRPDLAYPVSVLSRYVAPGRFTDLHWKAAKRVLRYLQGTKSHVLTLGGLSPPRLEGYTDSSWADDQIDRRSSQGYCFTLGSGIVSWRSTRSSAVSLSSCEAELYAGTMAAQEARWLTFLLQELGFPQSAPTLWCDNQSTIHISQDPVYHTRTKHIELRHFFIRDLVQQEQLKVEYVASDCNLADLFTKPLGKVPHHRLLGAMGLWDDCSDHFAAVRAFEGWVAALGAGNSRSDGYSAARAYCFDHFLSHPTMQSIAGLRRQLLGTLGELGLVDVQRGMDEANSRSNDPEFVRAALLAGLFPGVASAVKRTRSTTYKTEEDGEVNIHQ
ncbi:unnamed protein product, partial [Closterium sp. NIES-54]